VFLAEHSPPVGESCLIQGDRIRQPSRCYVAIREAVRRDQGLRMICAVKALGVGLGAFEFGDRGGVLSLP
jgi:hypothetical protein